jgi:transposase
VSSRASEVRIGTDIVTTSKTRITGGVDAYADAHVAAALSSSGRVLGTQSFPTTIAGYRRLLA